MSYMYLTGFDELDELTGGFEAGNLILLGARPGMGKSTFAYSVMENVFENKSGNCDLLALGSSENLIMKRLMEVRARKHGGNDPDAMTKALTDVYSYPMLLDCHSNTVSEMKNKILGSKLMNTLVIIDYLQLMAADYDRAEDEEFDEIARELRDFAHETGIPILVLSQLSRRPENRKSHRPILTDVRMSKDALSCFDEVMFLYRPSYYYKDTEFPNIAEIEVAVHPQGKTGVAVLGYDSNYGLFRNLKEKEREGYKV